jgi:hypothetical protein
MSGCKPAVLARTEIPLVMKTIAEESEKLLLISTFAEQAGHRFFGAVAGTHTKP